jgi:hypothetical protein
MMAKKVIAWLDEKCYDKEAMFNWDPEPGIQRP